MFFLHGSTMKTRVVRMRSETLMAPRRRTYLLIMNLYVVEASILQTNLGAGCLHRRSCIAIASGLTSPRSINFAILSHLSLEYSSLIKPCAQLLSFLSSQLPPFSLFLISLHSTLQAFPSRLDMFQKEKYIPNYRTSLSSRKKDNPNFPIPEAARNLHTSGHQNTHKTSSSSSFLFLHSR